MDQTLQFYGGRRQRSLSLTGLLLLALMACLLLGSNAVHAGNAASANNGGVQGADYWRQVTQGEQGYSTHKKAESGVLINRSGEEWRQLRIQQIQPYGIWALAGIVLLLAAVYLLAGPSKLEQPRSGSTLERWTKLDRYLHWAVAGLFIILTLTGLSLLYGRYFLPEVMGKSGFANYIQLAKSTHNYLGVLFALCLTLMILKWIKNNIPRLIDLDWFLQGGGMIKGKHPHAGYMNGGEKLWFWVLVAAGIVLSLSGLVLDFPLYTSELRNDLQLATVLHAISALILICGTLAHAYIGSIGTEGALEGMVTGQVDETWAKQHHDLWHQDLTDKK
ncbi:MAG: formate dehydrogenase subunit gamma [Motiliproteus sp.]